MRHLEHSQLVLFRRPRASAAVGFFVVAALIGAGNPARADRLPPGPVEELRQALRADKDGVRSEAGRKFREAALEKRVAAVQSLGDLSQALLLSDWKDAGAVVNPGLSVIDARARGVLAKRFVREVRRVLEKGDPISRAAAAGLVGDTAALARERDTQSDAVQSALEDLAKDLVQATKDPDERVRLQAIRSLGRVQTKSASSTVAPLGELFAGSSLAERRAAAGALDNLVRILPEVKKTLTSAGITGAGPAVEREDRIQISQAITQAARKGLADADVEVRRLCANSLFQTAVLLYDSDLIAPVRLDIELPPEDRPLTEAERNEIERLRRSVVAERKELAPLLNAFRDLAPALASAATDKDPTVRALVIRTLEELGNARQKLLLRAASVPEYTTKPGGNKADDKKKNGEKPKDDGDKKEDGKKEEDEDAGLDSADGIRYAAANGQNLPHFRLPPGEDPLLEGLEKTLRALAEALNDPKAQVRLAAVDTLETLGDDAAPAAPHPAWALTDPDRFVRRAAARTLGRMSPEKANAAKVVPNLIRMLDDPDLDLRLIAAQSLERYGPAAKTAVPALAKSTAKGDPEIRRAAIRALIGVGTDAAPAIPDIGGALSNSDVRVRRAAAEALARFGPLAKPAEAALRKSLDDSDAEVRRYAADSLLQLK